MSLTSRLIDSGWLFTQLGGGEGTQEGEWIPASSFPTTVHVELLKLKKIPDPFLKLHEWDVQWIGESQWDFKTEFSVAEEELAKPGIDLIFEGLDTFASVYLNGQEILSTDNQFVSHRVSVKKLVKAANNELLIKFDSAFLRGRQLEQAHGKFNLWNGDSSRLHVRKAGYNYGWDWGPVLMTVGPWKPIKLESYTHRLVDVDPRPNVSESLAISMSVHIAASESLGGDLTASITLGDASKDQTLANKITALQDCKGVAAFDWKPGELALWYPIGYGDQPLYNLEVQLKDATGTILDAVTHKISFRRVRVIEDKLVDQEGLTWLFEVNNIRIFCGGSNWIPADSFLTNCPEERYRRWLELLVAGNQNMIRVWGGGIYEFDHFYSICDELGIMVWQDFMFGCGQYPAYDSFVQSVESEATQTVKRLRSHPSVMIFAGNNEDYQIAEQFNLELDYSDETSDFRKTTFPARYIYERILPKVVAEHSNIHYHRSSPYSGHGKPTTDQTYGDLHQWNVWHGSQQPWHNWDILSGRFVSEFGMEGYPNIRTVDYWLGDAKSERYPQSRINVNHNKADGFERRLELYLMENFKHAFDMDSYVYYTQVMQAETLACAYRLWRRNWKGRGREYTSGALVWQLNDCWPTTSWAICDYFLRPKPAYFTIARELHSFTVGMTRKEKITYADSLTGANFKIETVLNIWGTNSSLSEKEVSLEVTFFDLHSTWKESFTKEVTLAPNSATEIYEGELSGIPVRTKKSEVPNTIIVSARFIDESGHVLARHTNWPEPFKYIEFPAPQEVGLKLEVEPDGERVVLSCKKPIKGLILDVEGPDVDWDDQAIDLVPGDPQTIACSGLDGRKIHARYLGDGSA